MKRPAEPRPIARRGRPAAATYRLTLEYDGTPFSGWQDQRNARTVMGELKAALAGAGLETIDLGGSGRTDAGVHALAQVAHLRLGRAVDAAELAGLLNDRLPSGIHVLTAEPAPPRFHARHDALLRSYLYQLARRRTAFAKRYVWWVGEPLDVRRMVEAAALVPGLHDFVRFCDTDPAQRSTRVKVERVEVAEDGELVLVRVVASHFLWRMVRRLVGSLVRVATGELAATAFADLLAGRPPAAGQSGPAQWTAPASGLFLERVLYRGEEELTPIAPATPVAPAPRPSPRPAPSDAPSRGPARRPVPRPARGRR